MEEKIQTRVAPDFVWQAWERAIEAPQSPFKYKILEIQPKKSFSILWKALFIRLVFTYTVTKLPKGSEITHKAEIKGLFALPVRWILGNKIKKNLYVSLKAFVNQLERT